LVRVIHIFLFLIIITLPHSVIAGDNPRKAAKKGVEYYNQEEYDKALAEFMAGASAAPERSELKYDIGTALYKLNDFEQASGAFAQAFSEDNPKLAADAWYNLGNAMFKSGELDKAVQAYKNSLILDHQDEDTKYNLELALMLQQIQQQQQKQCDSKCDSTCQKEQQPKPQPQPSDSTQQQQQPQPQQAEQDSLANAEQQPQPQEKETDMTPEEALQLLQALENDEQEAQKEKLERQFGKPKRVEKDW